MNITLTAEQEQFLQEQLKKGKYKTPQEVISKAFEVLSKEEASQPKLEIKGSASAQKLLAKKLEEWRKEREENKNKPIDPERQRLAQELKDLFDKTQSIPGIQDITDEEIQAEIDAYRRGE